MSNINDGGPAYPHIEENGDGSYTRHSGLSLRDYFAAAALQGWLSGPCQGAALDDYEHNDQAFGEHQAMVAAACYGYADAMLAARTKGGAS